MKCVWAVGVVGVVRVADLNSVTALFLTSHPQSFFLFLYSLQMLFLLSYFYSLILHSNLSSSPPLIYLRSRACPLPSFLGLKMLGVVMSAVNSSAVAFESGSPWTEPFVLSGSLKTSDWDGDPRTISLDMRSKPLIHKLPSATNINPSLPTRARGHSPTSLICGVQWWSPTYMNFTNILEEPWKAQRLSVLPDCCFIVTMGKK